MTTWAGAGGRRAAGAEAGTDAEKKAAARLRTVAAAGAKVEAEKQKNDTTKPYGEYSW